MEFCVQTQEECACDPSGRTLPRGSLCHSFGSPLSVAFSERFSLITGPSWNSLLFPAVSPHFFIILNSTYNHRA